MWFCYLATCEYIKGHILPPLKTIPLQYSVIVHGYCWEILLYESRCHILYLSWVYKYPIKISTMYACRKCLLLFLRLRVSVNFEYVLFFCQHVVSTINLSVHFDYITVLCIFCCSWQLFYYVCTEINSRCAKEQSLWLW